jgi:hypothetical protein
MGPDDDIEQLNLHARDLLRNIPKSVFGDLYRALLHSWELQAATGQTGEMMSGRPTMVFRKVHEDFVAILKTANLGDLVEKLHDALAQQNNTQTRVMVNATTVPVCELVSYVGRIKILNVRDRVWRRLISCVRISDGPLEGDYRVGVKGDDGQLLVNPMPAHAPVAVLPLSEIQEMR